MSRRIIRTLIQLVAIAAVCLVFALFLDNRYKVLPNAIHNRLPAHHAGLVVTDITVKTCKRWNLLSSCSLDPDEWMLINKDLYLNKAMMSKASIWVKRKQEAELDIGDKVVVDVRVSSKQPQGGIDSNKKWEQRAGSLWVLRSSKRHESDSEVAVTDVDVLFGPDAVDPRPGWTLRDTPLLLDSAVKGREPHLTVRTGPVHKLDKPVLRIGKNGRYKIMQIADLHLSTGVGVCRDPEPKGGKCEADTRTLEFISRLLDDERPDLVVLTGDQVNGDNTAPDTQTAILKFADLFIRRKIPFATIFGNHDDEGQLNRWESMGILQTLPYSLSEPGPSTASGVGNYVVEVLAASTDTSALSLYLLDTHKYSPDEAKYQGYDWIKPDQIEWFHNTAKALKPEHRKYAHTHMDLAFIHIPLPEYRDQDNPIVGQWREAVTAPTFNSHFADALVQEGVLLVSCGHDHVNDYCALKRSSGKEKKAEMWMCYGGGAGFGGYGGYGGYHRRVRFFDIDMNAIKITTYKRLEYGETEKRLDEQVIVRDGHVVSV